MNNLLLPGEKELGSWCYKERQRSRPTAQRLPLSAEQQVALAALPGWYWHRQEVDDERWEQNREALEAFCAGVWAPAAYAPYEAGAAAGGGV